MLFLFVSCFLLACDPPALSEDLQSAPASTQPPSAIQDPVTEDASDSQPQNLQEEPEQEFTDLPEDPHRLVTAGVESYAAGEWAKSAEAFRRAGEALPEENLVFFDQGVAEMALGRHAEARAAYLRAATAPDTQIAVDARYNLGLLSAEEAKSQLGENPIEVDKESRAGILQALEQASVSFRECLELKPQHQDARHNLELVRRYSKEIQDLWKQYDKQKEREEMDALQFIEHLQRQQAEIRNLSWQNRKGPPSPRWNQLLRNFAQTQEDLAKEIDPLKLKLREALQPPEAGQPGSPAAQPQVDPQQIQQMLENLEALAEDAREAMDEASYELFSRQVEAAREAQKFAAQNLENLYRALAPLDRLLRKGIKEQQALLKIDDPAEDLEIVRVQERQGNIQAWCSLIALHAEQQLEQLKPMAQQLPPLPDEEDAASENEVEEDEQTKHLRQLLKAMETAVELAPQAEQSSAAAYAELEQEILPAARPHQETTLELLKKIAEEMPKSDQQEEGENQEEQDQEQQEDQEEEQEQDQEEQEKQESDEQSENDSSDETEPQPQELTQDEIERILQRAKEREQEYREHKKELLRIQRALSGGKVEKDW